MKDIFDLLQQAFIGQILDCIVNIVQYCKQPL